MKGSVVPLFVELSIQSCAELSRKYQGIKFHRYTALVGELSLLLEWIILAGWDRIADGHI